MNLKKKVIFLGVLVLAATLLLITQAPEAEAKVDANYSLLPSLYLLRGENVVINVTIGAVASDFNTRTNITKIEISLPGTETFNVTSNGTSVSGGANFSVEQVGINTRAKFVNVTASSLVTNNSVQSFWFTTKGREFITGTAAQDSVTMNVTVTSVDSTTNSTTKSYEFAFSFSGYIKNETGCANCTQNGTNISIYHFVVGTNGPPTEKLVASNISNGSFIIQGINASSQLFKMRIIHYNATGQATKVGSDVPPLPPMMLFAMGAEHFDDFFTGGDADHVKEFMKPPTINGTTFYLQAAATINISAVFNSSTAQTFGYEVIDQASGFPLTSFMLANVTSAAVVVPTGRNYTVMVVRHPQTYPFAFGETGNICNGFFMNGSNCAVPPISNSTLPSLRQGELLNVTMNISIMNSRMQGCVFVGGNTTNLNMTSMITRMVPWTGFVPPHSMDNGQNNITSDFIENFQNCGAGSIGYYNISLMSATAGINYMVEFYAKNTGSEGVTGNATSEYFAWFQNISMTGNRNFNITLTRLLGTNDSTTQWGVNTSKIRVNIQNSTGQALTSQMHVEMLVKHPSYGTMHYIIEDLVNGSFLLPFLNDTLQAKALIYPQGPPAEKTINLSRTETNITIDDGNGFGFRKVNSSGQFEALNVSDLPIKMRFLRNSADCNVPSPSTDCELTTMTAENFNPFKALVAGKVNMEMVIIATNVTIRYVNFDMFAAKPPTNSIFNRNASAYSQSSTSLEQVWEFGGFAPATAYDHVEIKIPYNDTTATTSNYINEGWDTKINIPVLYNEDWKPVWNRSAQAGAANVPADYVAYNTTFYETLLNAEGVTCNRTEGNFNFTSNPCYMNTSSNELWLKLPHFSGTNPTLTGAAPAGPAPPGGSGGSKVGVIGKVGTPTPAEEKAVTPEPLTEKEKAVTPESPPDVDISSSASSSASVKGSEGTAKSFTLDGKVKHKVTFTRITSNTVTLIIQSEPVELTLIIGQSQEVDIDKDGKNDVLVTLVSILNGQAELTMKNLAPVVSTSTIPPPPITAKRESRSTWLWFIIGIVVLVIIVSIFATRKKAHRKEEHHRKEHHKEE